MDEVLAQLTDEILPELMHLLAGNPERQDVSLQDMSWTINCDNETVVTAFPLQKDAVTLAAWQSQHQQMGYTLQEADR